MNQSRNLNIIALIINITMVLLVLTGLAFVFFPPLANLYGETPKDLSMLKYYTILTTLMTLLAAFLMIWSNIVSIVKGVDSTPRLFLSFRMISATMSMLTFLTVVFLLRPKAGSDIIFSLQSGFLFMHFVCPLISILQFVLIDIEPNLKFKRTFIPFIITFVYAIIIFIITLTLDVEEGKAFAPYFFFLVTPNLSSDYLFNILIAFIVLISSYAISVVLFTLNRLAHLIIVGVEYEEKKSNDKKPSNLKELLKNEVSFIPNQHKTERVYHISYHDRKVHTWKVKSEHAGRAIKVFPNQKEAINYALDQSKKHNGSIRIHSMVGRIRKTNYQPKKK